MPAPRGNQFWKLRSTHGRKKLFASPKLLYKAATEYFQWCDNHPWQRKEQLKKPVVVKDKKGNQSVEVLTDIPTARPYSLSGLCIYLNVNTQYFNDFKDALKGKKDKKSQGFSEVIHAIEEIIYTQQFEGAAVGAFNQNIIARKLGLVEKVEAKNTNTNFNHNSVDLTPDDIKKFRKALEDEL